VADHGYSRETDSIAIILARKCGSLKLHSTVFSGASMAPWLSKRTFDNVHFRRKRLASASGIRDALTLLARSAEGRRHTSKPYAGSQGARSSLCIKAVSVRSVLALIHGIAPSYLCQIFRAHRWSPLPPSSIGVNNIAIPAKKRARPWTRFRLEMPAARGWADSIFARGGKSHAEPP
jgi:hypothetical protein